MAYLNNEIARLQNLINKIKNSEGYQIITEIAKQEVDSILENKKVMLSLAILSVVEALKNDTRLILGNSKKEEEYSYPISDSSYYYFNEKISNLCTQGIMIGAPIKYGEDSVE